MTRHSLGVARVSEALSSLNETFASMEAANKLEIGLVGAPTRTLSRGRVPILRLFKTPLAGQILPQTHSAARAIRAYCDSAGSVRA